MSAPHPFRMHPDLVVGPRLGSDGETIVIKQPWTSTYHQLGMNEWQLLQQLEVCPTWTELKAWYARHVAPERVGPDQLLQFLTGLQRRGILVSNIATGSHIHQQRERERSDSRWNSLFQLLCFRLPPVDCDSLLRRLDPTANYLFRPACVVASILLAATAVIVSFVIGRQPIHLGADWQSLHPQTIALFSLTLVGIKILHELGHALAARRCGVQCREIGVLLVAFLPFLYCDTSDAWMLPSRRKRMLISAAGIYVEFALAGIAWLVATLTVPGPLHDVAGYCLVICTVGTVLFNGNPLLRFDGYYLLSDMLAIPNLSGRARTALFGRLSSWLQGTRPPTDRHMTTLVVYGVLALVNRGLVLAAIVWGLYFTLTSYHLRPVADVVATLTVTGLVVGLVRFWVNGSRTPWRAQFWRRHAGLATLCLVVCGFLAIPFRSQYRAPATLHSDPIDYLYAPADGRLVSWQAPQSNVDAGSAVVVLDNDDQQLQLLKLQGEQRAAQLYYENLERRSQLDSSARDRLGTADAARHVAMQRVVTYEADIARMKIIAPRAGRFLHVGRVTGQPEGAGKPLLSQCNRGVWVSAGQVVGAIAPSEAMEAEVVVNGEVAAKICLDADASLRLQRDPFKCFAGRVVSISQQSQPYGTTARHEPTVYTVRVAFDQHGPRATEGAKGMVRVALPPSSLLDRIARFIGRNFRLL